MRDWLHAVARVLIGGFFAARALGLVADPTQLRLIFEAAGVSPLLITADAIFQLSAALFIVLGFQYRMAAAVLGVQLLWSSYLFNYLPGDPYRLAMFWRDLALFGGLMLLVSATRDRIALDCWLRRHERVGFASRRARPSEAPEAAAEPQPVTAAE
ncbi:MAG: DoxX family protein [Alphaproteobacteria bacterium]|nr:MAG: DoxX family protein [Alphaproteobacteria bacterium]